MSEAQLVEGRDGRLEIHGDLSFASVPSLWERYCARDGERPAIDIDLGGVARSDSAGLALLIGCLRRARETGKTVRFFNIPAQMLAIARASSLDKVLPLARD